MRTVKWVDSRGKRHVSEVRDNDPDSMAPRGVMRDPPDVGFLDWEAIKRDLHNALLDQGLISYDDIVRQQAGVTSAILGVMKRRVVALYHPVKETD